MKTTSTTARWLGTMALACSFVAFAASIQAGKPVKPPPEPPPAVVTGVIYAAIEGDIYTMNPDGSGQQYLFTPPAQVQAFPTVPSRLTHHGQRWFVSWQLMDGFYLDGVSARYRLIAMSEFGLTVVLHDDVHLQPSQGIFSSLRWMPGDGAVSWLAMRWEGGTVVEWGIYKLTRGALSTCGRQKAISYQYQYDLGRRHESRLPAKPRRLDLAFDRPLRADQGSVGVRAARRRRPEGGAAGY